MKKTFQIASAFAAFCLLALCPLANAASSLQHNFVTPPNSARPWVYWFWLNGNITKQGITADLESMRRVGIGGVLIMEVNQGVPKGPVPFGSTEWRGFFAFACSEAHRLGLEVNMCNDAGWCGSGGPWITPALSMQKLVWTTTAVNGPAHIDQALAQPQSVRGYYEDISVLAYPTPATPYTIGDIKGKAFFVRQDFPAAQATVPPAPDGATVSMSNIVNLSAKFENGRLSWDAPAGNWTILRIGHTSTGVENHPAPTAGLGLESDKLSKAATDAMFDGLMAKLIADNGPLAKNTLVSTHIDSWETGSQNWTPLFAEEFRRRRGYDPTPYLPVITGQVVENAAVSERFLWDWRQTITEMLDDNYAGEMRARANAHGLRLSIEAYGDCPTDDMAYAGQADEPMAEILVVGRPGWAEIRVGSYWCTEMTSAGHIYGKRIIGAKSFTASSTEKWQGYPANLKPLGDWAFCEEINRFVVHRYAMQPYSNIKPGVSMGPWGLHYERTETWWNQSKPWHEYLTRCQYMLRQGNFVADICYLEPQGSPRSFMPPKSASSERPGYNYDGCTSEAVLTRMSVKDGRIVLPDGMSYRVLALPDSQTITPDVLRKIEQLVKAGATVIGPRPVASPSLSGFPQCDNEVKSIAGRLWGDCDGTTVLEHRYGKGRVIWGRTPQQVLAGASIPQDFSCPAPSPVRFTHRHCADGTDIYFVANKTGKSVDTVCSFRVSRPHPQPLSRRERGVQYPIATENPEFWWPETGRAQPVAAYANKPNGVINIPIHLDATQSVFVVFQHSVTPNDPIASIMRNGTPIGLTQKTPATTRITILKAVYGIPGDPARTRDVTAKLQATVDAGSLSFQVADMAAGDDPAPNVVKTLNIEYSVGRRILTTTGQDPEIVTLGYMPASERVIDLTRDTRGHLLAEVWKDGVYTLKTAAGRAHAFTAQPLPAPQPIDGPWDLTFPPNLGASGQVERDRLTGWNKDIDPGIRDFSGTGSYRTRFELAANRVTPAHGLYLDLGNVQVMADVIVNGHDLGILWKSPYRIDITSAVRPGVNQLQVDVTDLWINRMIGDESLPDDSPDRRSGDLRSWPDWVLKGESSPTGRFTFTTWRLWKKDDPLVDSGLLGPVTLIPTDRLSVQ